MRPHDLETILFNLIDSRNVVQLKVMLFLTGNAEGYSLVQEATLKRLGISKDPYYRARKALIDRGWLSMEEDGDKVYIIVNYNKIYQEGKKFLEEGTCENTSDESNCENTLLIINKKEGNCQNTSDEGTFKNTADEGNCENYTDKEGTCENTTESTCEKYYGGNCDNYYNSIREYNKDNKIRAKSEEELKAEFDAQWKNGGNCENTTVLTGAAVMF